ncbi:MAG: hypothetical protein NTZ01_00915, partial [Verrucomicrobia bacterium]|nr:hypothetical protein [Verrucomicrobiota bacterium]
TDAETQRQLVQTLIIGLDGTSIRAGVVERMGVGPGVIAFRDIERTLSLQSSTVRANVRISPVRNTRIGVIQVQSQDPEFAARTANEVLAEAQILNRIGGHLQGHRSQLLLHQDELKIISRDTVDLQLALVKTQQQIELLKQYQSEGNPLEYFPAFETDSTLNNLKTQLMLVESEYDRIASQSTRGTRLQGKAAEVEGLKGQITVHAHKLETSLRTLAESQLLQFNILGEKSDVVRRLIEQNATDVAETLEGFANTEKGKRLISQDGKQAKASSVLVVLDYALEPPLPIRPILALNLLAGSLFGLALGLLLPVLMRSSAVYLKRGRQIRTILGQNFLGYMGPELSQKIEKIGDFIYQHPPYSYSEIFLFNSLLKITEMHPAPYILALVPCSPTGSASYLTADLAVQLVEANKKVLVVDLNLENPLQEKILGIPSRDGLRNFLDGDLPMSDSVSYSVVRELALIAPSGPAQGFRELLSRRPMAQAFAEEGTNWDFILIDAPSLLHSSELIRTLPVDRRVILTAGYGITRITDAQKTIRLVEENKWIIHGVVLRDCPPGKSWGTRKKQQKA